MAPTSLIITSRVTRIRQHSAHNCNTKQAHCSHSPPHQVQGADLASNLSDVLHVTWHTLYTSHVTQADINAVNLNGNAALHFAYAYKFERRTHHTSHVTHRSFARFQKVVDYLISHGADVSIVNCKCVAHRT